MSALHIVFISSWYPNRNDATHGVFNRSFALAAAMRSTVSVLHVSADPALTRGWEIETYEDAGIYTVQVYYPTAKRLPLIFGKIMQHLRRLRAYKKGFKKVREQRGTPDLIQLNVVLPAGPGASMLSRRYNIPMVINECWTGYDPRDGRYRGRMTAWMTKKVLRRAKTVMPVSSFMQQVMETHQLAGNYKVVPNVVDTGIFSPSVVTGGDGLTLIHVSALDDAQKNVSGILNAFDLASGKLTHLRLVIAGDGPDADTLRMKTQTMGLSERVRFTGKLTAAELVKELNAADVLIMFSNYESFCVAVPEALACCKPVITSDAGGIMSYFSNAFGLVVPAGNVSSLAAAIIDFPNRKREFDPQLLRDFVVNHFAPDVVCEKLHEVYREALASS